MPRAAVAKSGQLIGDKDPHLNAAEQPHLECRFPRWLVLDNRLVRQPGILVIKKNYFIFRIS